MCLFFQYVVHICSKCFQLLLDKILVVIVTEMFVWFLFYHYSRCSLAITPWAAGAMLKNWVKTLVHFLEFFIFIFFPKSLNFLAGLPLLNGHNAMSSGSPAQFSNFVQNTCMKFYVIFWSRFCINIGWVLLNWQQRYLLFTQRIDWLLYCLFIDYSTNYNYCFLVVECANKLLISHGVFILSFQLSPLDRECLVSLSNTIGAWRQFNNRHHLVDSGEDGGGV